MQRRTPSLTEKLRDRVERESDAILAPFFEALDAGESAELRMRAASALLDRVFGRPRQVLGPEAERDQEARLAEQTAGRIVEAMTDFARRLGHPPGDPEVRAAARAALQLVAASDPPGHAGPAAANVSAEEAERELEALNDELARRAARKAADAAANGRRAAG